MKKLIAIFFMTVSLYFIPEKTDLNRIEGEWVAADSAIMPMRFIFLGDYVHIFPDLASGVRNDFARLLVEAALNDHLTRFKYHVENDTMYCSRAPVETGAIPAETEGSMKARPPVCKIFVNSRDTLAMWERFNGKVSLYVRRR